jgi:hypothetical protein
MDNNRTVPFVGLSALTNVFNLSAIDPSAISVFRCSGRQEFFREKKDNPDQTTT